MYIDCFCYWKAISLMIINFSFPAIMSNKLEINVFKQQANDRVKIKTIKISQKNYAALFKYVKLKRLILKQLGFSSYNLNDITLSVLGVYEQLPQISTPIYNDFNLQFLMELALQNNEHVNLLMVQHRQLAKKQKRKPLIPMQFDSDGSIQSADEQEAYELLPKYDRYRGNDLVRCQFCHHSNKDKQILKYGGAFYGPYLKNKYTHFTCAIWRPSIYDKDKRLYNVQENIKQGIKHPQICSYCGKQGILLYCHASACKTKIHYICGLEKCQFNTKNGKYTFLCDKCRTNENKRKKLGWDPVSNQANSLQESSQISIRNQSITITNKQKSRQKIAVQVKTQMDIEHP